jgi:hypothetical protein
MAKTIIIKITSGGTKSGPFNIYDQFNNIIATAVPRGELVDGVSYVVDDSVTIIRLEDVGGCVSSKSKEIGIVSPQQLTSGNFIETRTGCLWRHLTDPEHFNYFYGVIEPYIIEYPFSYQYHDEILQSVKDYTKCYKYLPDESDEYVTANKIETDDKWFNKAVVYNGQQSSGMLELVAKPINNMRLLLSYPLYGAESKTITFTKSDNFYNFNTFWDVVKDKTKQLFIASCVSLSYDKIVNQSNMDYTNRAFRKSPLRAKDIKCRLILDDKNDVHLVSQMIFNQSQISYK